MPQTARRASSKRRLSADGLWEYAVKALSIRAHSTGELRRKLTARAENPSDIEDVIRRLYDCGYLNDQRFAESYAGMRLDNQGFGKTRVLRDLRERRVSSGLAEEAVAKVYEKVDEQELVEDFIRRKVRTKKPLQEALEDPNQLASAYRKLIRAGFGGSLVIQTLKRLAKRPELLESFEPPEDSETE